MPAWWRCTSRTSMLPNRPNRGSAAPSSTAAGATRPARWRPSFSGPRSAGRPSAAAGPRAASCTPATSTGTSVPCCWVRWSRCGWRCRSFAPCCPTSGPP
uniref:(northern house mosquito) hypothetical protein n=1 Tax=Culex pipiens TaxID=7175 RepID=A0A8D8GFC5_CULPI